MSPLLTSLATASRDWIGDSPTGAMLSAMRAFLSAAKDEALLREAAESLDGLEQGSAAFVAVAMGSAVERGASAQIAGPALIDTIRSWLPLLPVTDDEKESYPTPTPDQAMSLARLQFLCQSAVTHLALLPDLRAELARDSALLERLDELAGYTPGARWLHEALVKSSGTLVVLHPQSGTGARLRFTHVSNCFHLFSLLQTAVGARIPGGRDRTGPVTQGDEAWWHYGNPNARKPSLGASIWGEGLVSEIPRVDGVHVMLLWQQVLERRTWDAGFFTPHLEAMPADVTLEGLLSPEEGKRWLARLGVEPEAVKAWWRFWRR
jgi:hypothetical protein